MNAAASGGDHMNRGGKGDRLQKLLARAGLGSRRQVERWLVEGRIQINGRCVNRPGTCADLSHDRVTLDGRLIRNEQPHVYYVLNKPVGYVTTTHDPQGRPIVLDLFRGNKQRIFHVGRLDIQTSGLLILTNDGDLANKLMRPSTGCRKVYRVKVRGVPSDAVMLKLARGVMIDRRPTLPCKIKRLTATGNSWLRVVLIEGRRNQIRRMFRRMGHPVSKLHREAIGPIAEQGLPLGRFRPLTSREVNRLKDAVT